MRSEVTRPVRLLILALLVQLLSGCACGDCVDEDGDGFTTCDNDCNDSNSTVYPGALEICNGLDDDCSGLADQSFDRDSDGHLETASCPGVVGADDCNDQDATIFGGATEVCDEVDHNCDDDLYAGAPEASDFCPDLDGDGYPNGAAESNCGGAGWADCALETDCDDGAPTINPGITEQCDGVDEDCDGTVDNGFDADADTVTSCGPDGSSPSADDDCDDTDFLRFPGNAEDCDGLDNDCDGAVDNGHDVDGDGFTICGVDGDAALTVDNDCDDGSNAIFPGAPEICDSLDNDCDGTADDNTVVVEWYPDTDGDTFGDAGAASLSSCSEPLPVGSYVSNRDDCDDTDDTVSPIGTEVCDGVDNDCANGVDDGFDGDLDLSPSCGGDCDDANSLVFPGAPEICDGLDNDCDTDVPVTETDDDGDFFVECAPWLGVAGLGGGDCDDAQTQANPNSVEVCDGIDNDCQNGVDDGFADADGDGFAACADADCDDADPLNFPGNVEVCDGQDNDCDSSTNEQTSDADGDGATPCGLDGTPGTADDDCDDTDVALSPDDVDADGYSSCTGDCDEDSPLVHPGAPEYCNTVDNDCDGDADPANALIDGDGDGFIGVDCIDPVTNQAGTDCDDSNSAVFPVLQYTSGMQRMCRPAVYPGFRHEWHQFSASNPAYFFDPDPANPTPHYLYHGGGRTPGEEALGVVSSADGITWSQPGSEPLFAASTSGWDAQIAISRSSVIYVPTAFDGSVPTRPYMMAYGADTDIGLATAINPEGPFERLDLNGAPISGPVLEEGLLATDLDNKKVTQPALLRDSSGVLFMWYLGRSLNTDTNSDGIIDASDCIDGPDLDADPDWCPNAYTVLYATSVDGVSWQKFDTTAPGSPDALLTTGAGGNWDDSKLKFPTVHRNSDPLNTSQSFEVWYLGRSAIAQGGAARGENSIAWEKHPLNPCIPAYSVDPSRIDGKDIGKLDRRFEPDTDPTAAAVGAGVYHLYYHAVVNDDNSGGSTGLHYETYGTPAGNSFNDVHYIGYGLNNAPRLSVTGLSQGATVTSPLDLSGTVTDNAPETVLLTLLIDGIEQSGVAAITAADFGDFTVQTTDFTFSQIDLTQVVLDSTGTIGPLSSGTHVLKVEVSDQGGAERSTSVAVTF